MAKILIAEDDATTQILVAKYVEKMGHSAFISPHGRHAYETLIANKDFNLLVSDIMMPEMDGRQLIKTIKGNSSLRDLPIIIISAVIGVSDISDLLELGANFFLQKPMKREDFEEYVNRCLNK